MINVAINGFGRIGRSVLKIILDKKGINVVAVNDLNNINDLAHLLKYDTPYGYFDAFVGVDKDTLVVENNKIKFFSERDPSVLPWKKLKVDVVLECTGHFKTKELAQTHINAGAKSVIISAASKDSEIPMYLVGVNDDKIKKDEIISNASCTTNCLAPIMDIIEKNFGVKKALMTTVHSYTSTQNLVDGSNKDLRRARAAACNIIPTTTGAATATSKILPFLDKKFDGMAIRVPNITVSIVDVVMLLKKKTKLEDIEKVFIKAAKSKKYDEILAVNYEPLVSSDFVGCPFSAVIDMPFLKLVDGDFLKVVAWYDNEWGYSVRLADLALILGNKIKGGLKKEK